MGQSRPSSASREARPRKAKGSAARAALTGRPLLSATLRSGAAAAVLSAEPGISQRGRGGIADGTRVGGSRPAVRVWRVRLAVPPGQAAVCHRLGQRGRDHQRSGGGQTNSGGGVIGSQSGEGLKGSFARSRRWPRSERRGANSCCVEGRLSVVPGQYKQLNVVFIDTRTDRVSLGGYHETTGAST